jgi:DNA topoisomerase-3
MKHLPVIPEKFTLQPIERSESRLKLLQKLISREDVELVINACDAGREGELIFRYLMQIADSGKPTKRMWMQSMTNSSIIEAFGKLRDDAQMLPLADAALCRSESDWLIGLNGTRALTAFNSRHGGFNVTTAGRVQTPTLVILAEREKKIRSFEKIPYFEVHANFKVQAGEYTGRWFREDFKKDPMNRPERSVSGNGARPMQSGHGVKAGPASLRKSRNPQSRHHHNFMTSPPCSARRVTRQAAPCR